MISSANEIVARARALIGVPFRPQGRTPQLGLDCVGVVLWTFAIPASLARRDYRLRGSHFSEVQAALSKIFSSVAANRSAAGDVLLFALRREQAHLAISCGTSFIHADASLRRIVETPKPAAWPLVGTFRTRDAR